MNYMPVSYLQAQLLNDSIFSLELSPSSVDAYSSYASNVMYTI